MEDGLRNLLRDIVLAQVAYSQQRFTLRAKALLERGRATFVDDRFALDVVTPQHLVGIAPDFVVAGHVDVPDIGAKASCVGSDNARAAYETVRADGSDNHRRIL